MRILEYKINICLFEYLVWVRKFGYTLGNFIFIVFIVFRVVRGI